MICIKCGSEIVEDQTDDITEWELGTIIIRHVPCYYCNNCGGISYTGDVVDELEKLVEYAKKDKEDLAVIDYRKV